MSPLHESLREVRHLVWAVEAIARLMLTADDPLPLSTAIRACCERMEEELRPIVEQAAEGGQR
jgi:hypothetical protein